MNAHDMLQRLDDLGVGLTLDGDRIRYRSRGEQLAPELLAELKEHRDELVSILDRRAQLHWPPSKEVHTPDRRGPMSRAQRALWATEHFLDDGTYNLAGALRLRGDLDEAAFVAALEDVHRRHPSLRTVFPVEHGEPSQHILPSVATPVDVVASTLDECLAECARLTDEQIPLDAGPPVRMRLNRLAADDHVFFVVLHHIIADGVSIVVLLDDLARCYNARLAGEPVGPAHELDMIDYARWEEDHLQYGDLGPARRYWRDRLSGAVFGSLPLPPSQADARIDRGGAVAVVVDAAAVRELATMSRSSAFVVVSAAISAMLSRYTGRDDMVLGMPLARRDRDGLEHLVGLLLDTVPVRLDLGGVPSFLDLVKRTRTAVLGAVSNAFVPSDTMVGDHATGQALFNVVIADAGSKLPEPRFRGLETREQPIAQVGAKFDLNFLVRDDGDTVHIDVEFDRRAVSEADAVAMTNAVREVLAQGMADPHCRAADLAAAPCDVAGPGAVGVPADRVPNEGESLISRLVEMVQAHGDAGVISCDGVTLSYRDFARRAEQVARGLRTRGLGVGDVVAISLPRDIDLVVAIVGVMWSGAASLVLHDAWPQVRVDQVLTDAGVRLVIAPEEAAGRITVTQLTELGATAEACEPVPTGATAYVIYTSGSTGQPKGVHVSHRNLLSLLDGTAGRFGFGPADTWSLFHTCSFDVSMYEMFGCLLHGGRLVVVPKWITREPEAFAQLLRDERVTVLSQTPSAMSVMLPAIAATPGAAEHIRHVLFAGEALDRRLADHWYEALGDRTHLVNLYGITETTVHSSWHWLTPDEATTAESAIGDPLPGTSLHLLHDNGTPVHDRCVGEIYVGGPQVTTGYVGRPREMALRFVPDPFSQVPGARLYRSGDLARRTGTSLAYLARRDSQVQVNGFRIELSEIELALGAQPGVASAAAATLQVPSGSVTIVAIVVPQDNTELSTADLIAGVRVSLPRYMVPSTITAVEKLPLTNNGKLDRAAVIAAAAPSAHISQLAAPPKGAAETILVDLYREVLHDETVMTADDFFDRGGDSMRAIRLVGLAQERGLRFTVRDVYATPELAALAAHATIGDTGQIAVARAPFSLLPKELAGSFADDVEDAYPMTAMQSGMIYHQELAPEARVYHIVLSYRVRGTMDPVAFRAAAQAVTDAHPILRTSFDLAHADGPTQRVHTGVEAVVEFEDLRQLDPADQAARIQQVVGRETVIDFDLARPPLFRLVVLTRSAEDYQLIFTHHHAILDGWSVNIFFDDLNSHYQGLGPISRPRTKFAEYVELELRAMQSPGDAEFWRERVGSKARLIAPDRSGAPTMRQLHLELPGTIDDLRAAAARIGMPLKALLLAAHLRVVAWLTGHDQVVTSMVYACRPEEQDADRILGLFLNQLPIRLDLADQTWAELAQQGHQDESAMMAHRWYPNAAIQRAFGARPMFDSSFNFTDYHTTRDLVRSGSIEVLDSYELESTHYAFGSNYTVDIRTHELRLICEYDEEALTRSTVALAAEAHRRILAAIVADPDTPYRSTTLPGMADLSRLVEEPATPMPKPAQGPAMAPQTVLEHSVAEVWTEVLGAGPYDRETSFFDVGGDSLTAMRVVSRLRARHGTLSMGTFMRAGSIAEIASALDASQPSTAPEVVPPSAGRYPLSPAQHQMWLVAQQLPGLALFGMPGALQADGPLDLAVLKRTMAVLVQRHEALRTRIETIESGPVQVVEPHAELEVDVVDVQGDVAQCERLMAAAVREPIALEHAPLMRVTVYHIAEDRHVIYLNIHHIVCDGWSLSLLLREAAETYRAGANASDRAAVGSGTLTQARAEWTESLEAHQQRAYWVDRLAPPWSTLASSPGSRFAAVRPASFVERLRSASVQRRVDRDSARRHGMTEFMVLLTGFASALREWSGQDDIRIATVLANRARPGMEEIVGLVANTVVLRLNGSEDPAEQSMQACVDAYERQELPFEDVLQSLETRYPVEQRTGPVFEVMLVFQEETERVDPDDDLTFSAYESDRGVLGTPVAATTCDFVLGVTPVGGELVLNLLYKPASTDKALAVALLEDIATAVLDVRERQ